MRVLIVEDEVDTALVLETLATGWGYSVLKANNGTLALRTAVVFHPRVVLLDLALPDMHGYELAKQIRRLGMPPQPRFVALTGWGQLADQLRSASEGIDHHLTKPVRPGALEAILSAYQKEDALAGTS